MAKRVIFSFDDGRLDTYTVAVPIMQKYGLTATINITTDFIVNPDNYSCFRSACNRAMSIPHILELHEKGFEIASHGNHHINDPSDVIESVRTLKSWGINEVFGFASPESHIDTDNFAGFGNLIKEGVISYIRSGLQVRRQGLVYSGLYVMQNYSGSNALFYHLNKQTIIHDQCNPILEYGVSVSNKTTVRQIVGFIDRMQDNSSLVLIFHSILGNDHPGYGKDKWYWDIENFNVLCQILSEDNNCKVIQNAQLYSK